MTSQVRPRASVAIGPESRRPFTVKEYYAMAASGIIEPGERTELIDGEVISMVPIGPSHGWVSDKLFDLIGMPARAAGFKVRYNLPINLGLISEPQPDFYVCVPREHEYVASHPTAEDVLLVVEIADTSLTFDRNVKSRIYGDAGISEYWIVDLQKSRLVVHREPGGGGYRSVEMRDSQSVVSPLAMTELQISVGSLLPKRRSSP